MRLISVDLEMCQPSNKIIQIGAVCFEPDSGKQVGIFNILINPGEEISPFITELTGISNDHILNSSNIVEAASMFTKFKEDHAINSIGVVWGSALSNDIRQIYEESATVRPFSLRVIDVKAVYQMLANTSNAEMRAKVGLGKALKNVGLDWDDKYGPPHNALADAYNTYRIYMRLSKCLKHGFISKEV